MNIIRLTQPYDVISHNPMFSNISEMGEGGGLLIDLQEMHTPVISTNLDLLPACLEIHFVGIH